MRIAVMGSGGFGGYFGVLLARGGADVTFTARGAHLEAMHREGLGVEGGPAPFHLEQAQATDDPQEIGPVDVVMICVKLWDTEAALSQIRPLVGLETALVSFQNGVLKDSYLRAAYDEAHVIGGVGYVATTISRPGVISDRANRPVGTADRWRVRRSALLPRRRVSRSVPGRRDQC